MGLAVEIEVGYGTIAVATFIAAAVMINVGRRSRGRASWIDSLAEAAILAAA